MVKWRAWYDNSSVYNSTKHVWANLPDDGLLIRIIYNKVGSGKEIQMGMDYYYEAPHESGNSILGSGNDADDIEERYPDAVVKRGRWAPRALWEEVLAEAMASVNDF
jgi:hypothetical protein